LYDGDAMYCNYRIITIMLPNVICQYVGLMLEVIFWEVEEAHGMQLTGHHRHSQCNYSTVKLQS